MTDPAEKPEEDTQADEAPPPKPKKKMSLRAQVQYLQDLRLRCKFKSPQLEGADAEETIVILDAEDIATLECIVETMDLFALYGADQVVRDRIARQRRGSGN